MLRLGLCAWPFTSAKIAELRKCTTGRRGKASHTVSSRDDFSRARIWLSSNFRFVKSHSANGKAADTLYKSRRDDGACKSRNDAGRAASTESCCTKKTARACKACTARRTIAVGARTNPVCRKGGGVPFWNLCTRAHFNPATPLDSLSEVEEEEEEEIYLPRTITILNQKNTILMLARSRLTEKQKAIYAGRMEG